MPGKHEIMRAIYEGLNSLKIKRWGYAKATRKVKTKLRKIGQNKNLGCEVYANNVEKANGAEWLYDLIWLEYRCKPDRSLRRAHLVAEIEWSNQDAEIEHDFEKLLLARASARLMIFGGWDECGTKKRLNWMTKKIGEFKPSCDEDAWLLAACEGSDNEGWSFRVFTIQDNAAVHFCQSSWNR